MFCILTKVFSKSFCILLDADINKRDFSGRKPRHYLQSSSSNYIKRKLRLPSDIIGMEDDDAFLPGGSEGEGDHREGDPRSGDDIQLGKSFTRVFGRFSFRRPTTPKVVGPRRASLMPRLDSISDSME